MVNFGDTLPSLKPSVGQGVGVLREWNSKRDELSSSILSLLPNITRLSLQNMPDPTYIASTISSTRGRIQLKRFHYIIDDQTSSAPPAALGPLLSIIQDQPSLKSVLVSTQGDHEWDLDPLTLFKAMMGLPELEELVTSLDGLVRPVPWRTSQLKSLTLLGIRIEEDLVMAALRELGTTLERVDLPTLIFSFTTRDSTPLHLPKLVELTLATISMLDVFFLPRFALAPIRIFRMASLKRSGFECVCEFLRADRQRASVPWTSSLTKVVIGQWDLNPEQISVIKAWPGPGDTLHVPMHVTYTGEMRRMLGMW